MLSNEDVAKARANNERRRALEAALATAETKMHRAERAAEKAREEFWQARKALDAEINAR